MKRLLFPLLALSTIFLASCTNNSNKIGTQKVSETQEAERSLSRLVWLQN
ncbi:hypothetical protein [Prochlorococcus marinus]|nr:hypothetical protein [Prochlorococcus marinus]